MPSIQNDSDFLAMLYHLKAEEQALNILDKERVEFEKNEQVAMVMNSGYFKGSEKDAEELYYETFNPSNEFTGKLISEIKQLSLSFIGDDAKKIENILVGLVPTHKLNATTIKTPTGGSIILLDSGVKFILPWLFDAYISFFTWDHQNPYSHEHSKEEYSDDILRLALYYVTKNWDYLSDLNIIQRSDTFKVEQMPIIFAVIAESLMLAHEFGHILLDHLLEDNTKEINFAGTTPVKEYDIQVKNEIAADIYAIQNSIQNVSGIDSYDILFVYGVVLSFILLCEDLREALTDSNNPLGETTYKRWYAIQEYFLKKDAYEKDKWVCYINKSFTEIRKGLKIMEVNT